MTTGTQSAGFPVSGRQPAVWARARGVRVSKPSVPWRSSSFRWPRLCNSCEQYSAGRCVKREWLMSVFETAFLNSFANFDLIRSFSALFFPSQSRVPNLLPGTPVFVQYDRNRCVRSPSRLCRAALPTTHFIRLIRQLRIESASSELDLITALRT